MNIVYVVVVVFEESDNIFKVLVIEALLELMAKLLILNDLIRLHQNGLIRSCEIILGRCKYFAEKNFFYFVKN